MKQIPFFDCGLPTEQRTCIEYICELSQFPRIKGESRKIGWPKAVILLEICAFGTKKLKLHVPDHE
jgi:hypothetical protein